MLVYGIASCSLSLFLAEVSGDHIQHAAHRRLKRSAVADKTRLWPNGIVYYSISDGFTG